MRKHLWWALPTLLFLLITPFTARLDLAVASFFYRDGAFHSNGTFDMLYQYGVLPAELTAIFALIIAILGYLFKPFHEKLRPALLLVLTMALGAGFITHTLLKDRWGRPRPKQVVEFGGSQAFRPYYKPNFFNQPEPSRSFPCGHCTMGFFFFAVALLFQREGRYRLAFLTYLLALALGWALGIARMAQGGHFISDVLASMLIMWLAAAGFDRLLYLKS